MRIKYHILIAALTLASLLWLSLNLNLNYEIDRSIPVKINVNRPYAITNILPSSLNIKIKGSGWALLRLFTSFSPDFNYDINAFNSEQHVILTKPYLNDNVVSGQNLIVTYVKPESLFINIGKYEEKYIKIFPQIIVECRDGYQTVGVPVIEPDSILVGGASQIIKTLKYIHTENRLYVNVNSDINDIIGLSDSLENITWRAYNKVRLFVKVELTAEKEFRSVEIKIPDVPYDREVLLIPQMISIQVKGGVNQLANLDNAKIHAIVDFNELLKDTTGSVVPHFSAPEGITVISSRPDRIQYVIKKKL